MSLTPELLLVAYCIAIALLSLAGGLLPNWVRMTHTRTQLVMSFVSGLMLGVAFYHLLPHSIALQPREYGADASVWWLMIGLITMLLLLRMFHFHQHDFSEEEHEHHDHDHSHAHGHEHHGGAATVPTALVPAQAVPAAHRLSWIGLALGLGVHTLIDGVALGAVMQGGSASVCFWLSFCTNRWMPCPSPPLWRRAVGAGAPVRWPISGLRCSAPWARCCFSSGWTCSGMPVITPWRVRWRFLPAPSSALP